MNKSTDNTTDATTTISPSSDDATNLSEKNSGSGGTMLMQAFAAGSIASSCCLIQLGMNVLSYCNIIHIGCAGFNKTLGPLRPYTRTMTIAWLLWNWVTIHSDEPMSNKECCSTSYSAQNKKKHNRSKRRLLYSTLICLFLMFMPEFLDFGRDIVAAQKLQSMVSSSSSSEKSTFVKLEYVVDNMGCEACVSAVEGIVSRHDNVAMGKVTSFDLGTLDLYVHEDVDVDKITDTSSSISDSETGKIRRRLEREINDLLQQDGYELHEKGWITKRMKMENDRKSKNVYPSFVN